MANQDRQAEVQELVQPIIEHMLSDLKVANVEAHEAAQVLILVGSGMLARALGPHGAGRDMREVADQAHSWMNGIADQLEAGDRVQ